MDILIRLAGVQFGPYSEEQIQQHLAEGLLSLTDPAQLEGKEDWVPLGEALAKLHTTVATQPVKISQVHPPATDAPPKPAPEEESEAPKRAPTAPPGVTHLPPKRQDSNKVSLPAPGGDPAKKTILIGPTAPAVPSSSGQAGSSTVTTSPLASGSPGTKKLSRSSSVTAFAQKTAPLPTKLISAPSMPPTSPAPATPDAPPPPQPDAKEASPSSLIKALSAKTVPMRSTQAPPLSSAGPGTLPITTPLPTKPVPRPASGTVPPPSIVSALTKKLGQVEPPDPVQTDPPTLGLSAEVKTAKLPRPKTKVADTKAADTPAALISVEPVDEPSAPSAPRRILPGLICAWGVLALLAAYYVWSPYHAAASLRNAVGDGDPAELDAAIDFASVQASLKEQIKDQLAPAGSASSVVLSILDHSIDRYVTADGISALVQKSDAFAKEDQSQLISPDVAAKLLLTFSNQPVRNQGLVSLGDFVLDRDAALLHLQYWGLGWKLKQADLRLPAQPGAASTLLAPVIDTYLERGDAKAKKGDWNGAIADFTQVLAIDPQSSIAYNDRGAVRQSKGDLDGALKDYTQALAIDPQMAAAYDGRGNVKAAGNDLVGAIADYTQAVHFDPSMAAAYDGRGNAKTDQDDLDGAIADFTQAIAIDPTMANAYSDRGFARQANGNFDGAISDYTQALMLKPKTASAYYNRGLAKLSQGNFDAAIVDFDQALAIDPKIPDAYYYRGNAKNANHDLDGAIADFTQAVALNPKRALAYCNRGLARQAKGDLDGAVADYTQALAIDPKIASAYYNRGLIEEQKNDLDSAIADSTQALYLDPKNGLAYYNRGFAKLAKGNLDGAADDLKEFYDLAPKDPNADHARLYLWLIAREQNPTMDADQELTEALENSWNSSPDDMVSKTAAFLLGRTSEAAYLAAAASPDAKIDQAQHCQAWYFAGMRRLLTGDKMTAVDYFRKCLATKQMDYCEYILAKAELQALEPAPPPAPVKSP
jgi:tetratricopeptide (TPR) repeat protein